MIGRAVSLQATFVLHSSHADKSRSSIMLYSAVNGTPFSVNDQVQLTPHSHEGIWADLTSDVQDRYLTSSLLCI